MYSSMGFIFREVIPTPICMQEKFNIQLSSTVFALELSIVINRISTLSIIFTNYHAVIYIYIHLQLDGTLQYLCLSPSSYHIHHGNNII